MEIILSNASPDPIYAQIVRQVRDQIVAGTLAEGEALPSIRVLARDLGVSVITTKRAYEDLEREGFIDTVSGKGCFVAAQHPGLLEERRLRAVENHLAEAVREARIYGIGEEKLREMLAILYAEEVSP